MNKTYELPITPHQWFDLVWFLPTFATEPTPPGWLRLHGHACGGISCESLDGWVLPVKADALHAQLRDIVEEAWCTNDAGLDHEVTDRARSEYASFLTVIGLASGDLAQLRQAVYPLSTSTLVLAAIGAETPPEPSATLLVLGTNCD